MQYLKYSDENWSSFVSPYDFVVGVIKRREGAKYYCSFEHIISKLTVYLPVLILNFARWGGGGVYNPRTPLGVLVHLSACCAHSQHTQTFFTNLFNAMFILLSAQYNQSIQYNVRDEGI